MDWDRNTTIGPDWDRGTTLPNWYWAKTEELRNYHQITSQLPPSSTTTLPPSTTGFVNNDNQIELGTKILNMEQLAKNLEFLDQNTYETNINFEIDGSIVDLISHLLNKMGKKSSLNRPKYTVVAKIIFLGVD